MKVKSEEEIREALPFMEKKTISHIASRQLGHCFNGYAQYFNLKHDRTGKLLEAPFRRKLVSNEAYLTQLIFYIHANPQLHGFVDDFRDYPHSSYAAYLSQGRTRLPREEVLGYFGQPKQYQHFHRNKAHWEPLSEWFIEVEG